jgi:hypothetical protein
MARIRRVSPVAMRHTWDCGIAALASVLRLPYGDVVATARALYGKAVRHGFTGVELERIAATLGRPLRRLRRPERHPTGVGVLGLVGLFPG